VKPPSTLYEQDYLHPYTQKHTFSGSHTHSKDGKTYAEASLGGELYEIKMNIIPSQESIMAAVKRDSLSTDLCTWHRRLGHLSNSMLKKLVNSNVVKGMEVTNTHLNAVKTAS